MNNDAPTVGILGGGISGLSAAYALQKKGISTRIYEQSHEVGGDIRSVKKGDWLVEEGPNTFMIRSQAQWDLLDELGLSGSIQRASDSSSKRFVLKNDQPVSIPFSFKEFLSSSLISPGAKLRLLKEPFVASSHLTDESIASFIRRRLGSQLLDYAVNPFVSGVYAGNPEELSIRHTFSSLWEMEQEYGSLTLGMIRGNNPNEDNAESALISFDGGCQALPKALANALKISPKTNTSVWSIVEKNGQWLVETFSNEQKIEFQHDSLISTLPMHRLADVFKEKKISELSELPYAPMSVLAMGFNDKQIAHPLDGFGMLIPEVENYQTLGVMFSSSLFNNRAPDGKQLLTCFIGGARHPRTAAKSKDELKKMVLVELEKMLAVKGNSVFMHHRYWPKAIPQYQVGFDRYLSLLDELEKNHPGLFLNGNFRGGISVPDCISKGFEAAQKVSAFLKSKK